MMIERFKDTVGMKWRNDDDAEWQKYCSDEEVGIWCSYGVAEIR